MQGLLALMRLTRARLLSLLSEWRTRHLQSAFVTVDGVNILLKGKSPSLAATLDLWFPEQVLTPLPLGPQSSRAWTPDLVLSATYGRTGTKRPRGLIVDVHTQTLPLRTQPYLEMDVPLSTDFDRFLMDVMPKKRRAYIRKALALPYRESLTRDATLLSFFLDDILAPVTQQKHGDRSQLLGVADILAKGEKWQLQLLYDAENSIVGGNLLLMSSQLKQLRIWRQAVHPRFDGDKEKQNILLVLNSLPLQLGSQMSYRTVSFGISPHTLDHSNFYSKRLWACRPQWNLTQPWVDINAQTEAGRQLVEQRALLCTRPGATEPDTVLLPRVRMLPPHRSELLSWLNQYGHENLKFIATLHKGLLRFQSIESLQAAMSKPASLQGQDARV